MGYITRLAADEQGRVYIADSTNGRVRRLDADGSITTVVSGLNLAEGLAVGGGRVYVATGHEKQLLRFDLSSPASPAHVLASTSGDAYGLALAPGNTHLYSANGDRMGIIDLTSSALSSYLNLNGLSGISFAQGMRAYAFRVLARNGADVSAPGLSAYYPTPTPLTEADVDLDDTGAAQAHISIGKSAASTCSTVRGLEFTATPPGAPASAPLGVLRFKAEDCNAGSYITVRIDYPPGSLAGLYPWKYGPRVPGGQPEWFRWGVVEGDSVYYTVSNDGIGDSAANDASTIEDPHAMLPLAALPPAPGPGGAVQPVPTLSAWSVALLAALAALLGLRRRV